MADMTGCGWGGGGGHHQTQALGKGVRAGGRGGCGPGHGAGGWDLTPTGGGGPSSTAHERRRSAVRDRQWPGRRRPPLADSGDWRYRCGGPALLAVGRNGCPLLNRAHHQPERDATRPFSGCPTAVRLVVMARSMMGRGGAQSPVHAFPQLHGPLWRSPRTGSLQARTQNQRSNLYKCDSVQMSKVCRI